MCENESGVNVFYGRERRKLRSPAAIAVRVQTEDPDRVVPCPELVEVEKGG